MIPSLGLIFNKNKTDNINYYGSIKKLKPEETKNIITYSNKSINDNYKTSIFKDNVLYLDGVKWYSKMYKDDEKKYTRSLLEDYSIDEIHNLFIVALDTCNNTIESKIKAIENVGTFKKFAIFKDYIEFYHYSLKFIESNRSFYEIILGDKPQKPYFDIDIEKDKFLEMYPDCTNFDEEVNKIIDTLIDSCFIILKNQGITLELDKNILLFTSHNDKKRSIHLVIDGYCHVDNYEAKEFNRLVINKFMNICDIKYSTVDFYNSPFIDKNVYKKLQQFRMLGSQKRNSGRTKKFNKKFYYKGQEVIHKETEKARNSNHQNLIDLSKSLITFTYNCVRLNNFLLPEQKIKKYIDFDDLVSEEVKLIIDIYKEYYALNMPNEPYPYKFKDVKGQLICLSRMIPSYCEICNRIHENENPYLYLIGNTVYWNCRRCKETDSIIIGYFKKINNDGELKYDNTEIDYDIKFEDNNIKFEDDNIKLKDNDIKEDVNIKEDDNIKSEDVNIKEDDNIKLKDNNIKSEDDNIKLKDNNIKKYSNNRFKNIKYSNKIINNTNLRLNRLYNINKINHYASVNINTKNINIKKI